MSRSYSRYPISIAALLSIGLSAFGQSLTLSSASGGPGATVPLNITLAYPSGSEPAALQWTFLYPYASVSTVSVTPSAAMIAAGKSISCASAPGAYRCVVFGSGSTPIPAGDLGVAAVTLSANVSGVSITVGGTLGSTAGGSSLTLSSTNGAITSASGTTTTTVTVASLSCAPAMLAAGGSSSCVVNIGGPAPAGGVSVGLASTSAALTVPASVTVAANASSATFTATAGAFSADQTASITATLNGSTVNTPVSLVTAAQITSMQCAAMTLSQNSTTTCTLSLSRTAPAGGVFVTLTSSAAGLIIPSSVTVAGGATSANFTASTGTISTNQTATITASANGSSKSAVLSLAAPPAAPTLTSVVCAPATLGPNASGTCAVTLSQSAGSTGAMILLSSNSTVLTVPASVTVSAASATAAFPITSGAFSTPQSVTITAVMGAASTSTTVSLSIADPQPSPYTRLLIHGDATEVAVATNGAALTPAIVPAGMAGKVVVNGSGSVTYIPGSGVSFRSCCSNVNNAYYKFTGAGIGNVFNSSAGLIGFTLTSRYAFAERQSAGGLRYAFDARDANGHQFYFVTDARSGSLVFTYMVRGSAQYYVVPKGTEDQVFGKGVSVKVGIRWDTSTVTLLLNDAAVKTSSYTAVASNWTSASIFDLGAYEYLTYGGYDSLEDAIREFSVAAPPMLQLRGDATEVSGVTNGATVTPASGPAGLSGKVVVNGTGSVNFVAGSGVSFRNCCSNTNNAYYKFTGAAVGNAFNLPTGEISFNLTSRYTFAQRQGSPGYRYAFDVRDASAHQFYFLTNTSSGSLIFSYMVQGVAQYYVVPKGTEDSLFGAGVTLKVTIRWNGATATLLLNDIAAKTTAYTSAASNWTTASVFDLGAYEYLTMGGYYALDDVIGGFTVRGF